MSKISLKWWNSSGQNSVTLLTRSAIDFSQSHRNAFRHPSWWRNPSSSCTDMQIQKFYKFVDKGPSRSQQCFDVIVTSSFHPKGLGSPLLLQWHEQVFPVPKWNDFVLCSVYDKYGTFDLWSIVNIWKLIRNKSTTVSTRGLRKVARHHQQESLLCLRSS